MVKRRPPSSGGDTSYVVGYGRPPVHSRFQPGQSGNPAGRLKGVRNLISDVKRTLLKPVRLKEEGRTQRMTTQESLLLVLRQKALQGDGRAIDRLIDLAQRFNNDLGEAAAAQPLPAEDQAILDAYTAERARGATTATVSTSPVSPPSKPRVRPRKRRAQ